MRLPTIKPSPHPQLPRGIPPRPSTAPTPAHPWASTLLVVLLAMLGSALWVRWWRPLNTRTLTPIRTGTAIDLNRADADTLSLLPGIGPQLGQRIIQSRAARGGFAQADQLQAVSGIGLNGVARVLPWVWGPTRDD